MMSLQPVIMNDSTHFAICIHNGEYAGTLELRKVYELLEDSAAAKRNSFA